MQKTHPHCPSYTSLYLSRCHSSIPKRVIQHLQCPLFCLQPKKHRYLSSQLYRSNTISTCHFSCLDMESLGIVANCSMSQWQPLLLHYVAYTIIYRGTLNAHVAQSGTEGVIHRGWTMTSLTAAPFLQTPPILRKSYSNLYTHTGSDYMNKGNLFPSI